MTVGMFLFVAITVAALVVLVQYLLTQYVLPPDEGMRLFAKDSNVSRRHLESIRAWGKRVEAVHRSMDYANRFFYDAAQMSGSIVHEGRAIIYSLPHSHPASVLLLHAKYPDGPSFEELAAIAGFDPSLVSQEERFSMKAITDDEMKELQASYTKPSLVARALAEFAELRKQTTRPKTFGHVIVDGDQCDVCKLIIRDSYTPCLPWGIFDTVTRKWFWADDEKASPFGAKTEHKALEYKEASPSIRSSADHVAMRFDDPKAAKTL